MKSDQSSVISHQLHPRSEPVTQAVFDRLPALLTRAQFMLVTGIGRRDLEDMTTRGELQVWRNGGKNKKGYRKWHKADAAKICKFKL